MGQQLGRLLSRQILGLSKNMCENLLLSIPSFSHTCRFRFSTCVPGMVCHSAAVSHRSFPKYASALTGCVLMVNPIQKSSSPFLIGITLFCLLVSLKTLDKKPKKRCNSDQDLNHKSEMSHPSGSHPSISSMGSTFIVNISLPQTHRRRPTHKFLTDKFDCCSRKEG